MKNEGCLFKEGGRELNINRQVSIFLCLLTKLTFMVRILLLLLIQLEFYCPLSVREIVEFNNVA